MPIKQICVAIIIFDALIKETSYMSRTIGSHNRYRLQNSRIISIKRYHKFNRIELGLKSAFSIKYILGMECPCHEFEI